MNDLLSGILELVQDVDPVLRTVLSGLAIFLETSILVGLIVPGDTIIVVSATAIGSPFEYWALLVAVIIGSLAGESVGFALGRFFGHRIRESRLGARIGAKHWVRAENYLDRRGGVAVFISRFLPILHALIPLTVGMSTMSYRKFLAWTTPACIVWATAYVSVGAAAAGSYRSLADQLHYAGFVFAGILVVFVLLVFTVKHFLRRGEERHMLRSAGGRLETHADGQGERKPATERE